MIWVKIWKSLIFAFDLLKSCYINRFGNSSANNGCSVSFYNKHSYQMNGNITSEKSIFLAFGIFKINIEKFKIYTCKQGLYIEKKQQQQKRL